MGNMNNVNINNGKEKLNIPTMLFCIIGVVLVGLGIMLVLNNDFRLNVIPTKGTVTSIKTEKDEQGRKSTYAVIQYTASSGSYDATIVDNDAKYQMGNEIILYYDFFKPESVNTKPSGYIGYISLIIGLILALKTGPRFFRIIRDNYLLTE